MDLGTLSFDTRLNAQAVQDAETIKKQVLHKLGNSIPLKIKVTFTSKDLRADLQSQLNKFKPKVKVDIVVDQATASQAVQQALAKAGLMNNATAGQLRAQKMAYIQQKMALELAKAQRQAAAAADKHSKSMITLNSHFGNGISLGGRLSATVASIYSVYTLKNFMQSMIEIGGEFQKQRIALETMLGSLSKADVMYRRMKELAVESPFTFMDLMSYTKQLKAFQIPYNELFETTKRLGDISAGLGVDMNRLILAFGQVRAAAFLRGQEVRQFTEAGIPLVDALAKKFTELENRAVSAGEVFEKISKRQVSFGMVKDVLWELTDEGGQFYNMQSKLTESLSGKLDKLKDSYQIMVAEMAQGNNEVLGGMLDAFTKLVQYGDKVIGMLGSLTGAFLAYKAAIVAVNAAKAVSATIEGIQLATARLNAIRAIKGLTAATWGQVAAQQALNAVMSVSPTTWIAAAVAAITTAIGLYATFSESQKTAQDSLRDLNSEFQKQIDEIEENDAKAKSLINTIFDQSKSIDEQRTAYERLQKIYPELYGALDLEAQKRLGIITTLQAENQWTKQVTRTKIDSYKKEVQMEKAKLEHVFKMFYGDNGKYNINNPLDRLSIERKVRANSGEEYAEDFKKFIKQYQSLEDELDNIDKLYEDIGKKAASIDKNRKSKWWNTAKDLAGDLTMYAPKEDQDFEDYFEQVAKNLNNRKSILDKLTKDAPNYAQVKNDVDTLTKIYTAVGGNIEALSKFKSKGSTKDPQLEVAKTKLAEYKAFLSEYRKYRETYSREDAIKILEDLFPNLKGKGAKLVDNYVDELDKLRDSLDLTTEQRKKWANDINKTKADVQFEREAEAVRLFSSEMELALKRVSRQWDIYKKIIDTTGDRLMASRLSGLTETSKADALRAMIQAMVPSKTIDFRNVINMGDDQIDEYVKKLGLVEKKAQSVAKALKEWRDAQMELRNEALEVYGQMIADAGGLGTEIDKINEKYDEQIRKLREIKELTPEEQETRKKQTERSRKLDIAELFVNSIDFGEIFELLGNAAIQTAKEVKTELDKLISGADAKNLTQAELERYLKLQNALNTVGGQKSASLFSKAAWSELSSTTKALQASVHDLISSIQDYNKAVEDEEQAMKDLESATTTEAGMKAQMNLNDAKARKKEAKERAAQASKNVKQQGQELSDAQKQIIQGAQDISTSMQQVFSGSLSSLTTGILNLFGKKSGMGAASNLAGALSNAGVANVYAEIIAAILEILDTLKDDATGFFRDILDDIFDAVVGILDDLGSGELIGTIIGEVLEGVSNIMKSAFESIGNVFDGSFFTGLWDGISSAFSNDDELQELIENSQKQVELLQGLSDMLDKNLERALGGVYTTKASQKDIDKLNEYRAQNILKEEYMSMGGIYQKSAKNMFGFGKGTSKAVEDALDSQTYYNTKLAELYIQRDELNRQLEAEQDKKDSDAEQVEDFKQQIAEMEDQIDHFAEDLAKTLYDIDVKSWASGLGDALFDAWQKGEDGAEAFAKKARELLSDVAKNIVTTSIIETALQPVLDTIKSEMKNKEGKLDAKSIGNFASKLGEVMGWLPDTVNAAYDAIDEELQKRGLGSMKEEDNTSSSTSSSIKGITEQTADLLAAYLNAVRADVSVMRSEQAVHLPAISIATQRVSVLAEAQVTLQQQIAANTLRNAEAADKIYDLLHKVAPDGTKINVR